MRNALLFLSVIFLLGCGDSHIDRHSATDSLQTNNGMDTFSYRDLFEGYVDKIQPKDISRLFGQWTITSIAKTGGALQQERTIQQQIGHRLFLDENVLTFDFLNNNVKIEKPRYQIVYFDEEKGDNLKGTSYFHGYRMCRKNVMMLQCSENIYFEVIHFQEMTYFYDGRIYFLTKDE